MHYYFELLFSFSPVFLLGLLVLWVGIGIDLHLSMHWLSGLGLLIVSVISP